MGVRCIECGEFVEPTKEAIELGVCARCNGIADSDAPTCFDGSVCTEAHRDCNKCKWMKPAGQRI